MYLILSMYFSNNTLKYNIIIYTWLIRVAASLVFITTASWKGMNSKCLRKWLWSMTCQKLSRKSQKSVKDFGGVWCACNPFFRENLSNFSISKSALQLLESTMRAIMHMIENAQQYYLTIVVLVMNTLKSQNHKDLQYKRPM